MKTNHTPVEGKQFSSLQEATTYFDGLRSRVNLTNAERFDLSIWDSYTPERSGFDPAETVEGMDDYSKSALLNYLYAEQYGKIIERVFIARILSGLKRELSEAEDEICRLRGDYYERTYKTMPKDEKMAYGLSIAREETYKNMARELEIAKEARRVAKAEAERLARGIEKRKGWKWLRKMGSVVGANDWNW